MDGAVMVDFKLLVVGVAVENMCDLRWNVHER